MKFNITDKQGRKFVVNKQISKKVADEAEEIAAPVQEKDFSKKELEALKNLAKKADELLALLDVEHEEHGVEEFDSDELEFASEEKEELEEKVEDSEEVEDIKLNDSKKSFGSIERKVLNDSNESQEDEIMQAWANYYKPTTK